MIFPLILIIGFGLSYRFSYMLMNIAPVGDEQIEKFNGLSGKLHSLEGLDIEEGGTGSINVRGTIIKDVLNGVLANSEAIDARISEYAIDWTLERMPAVDRNILRVAVYEMFFAAEKLVPNVAINEAVEIAKIYGTDDTPRFINGVLGKMVRSDV